MLYAIPAFIGGFILAHLLLWLRRRQVQRGERLLTEMRAQAVQGFDAAYDKLFDESPELLVTTQGSGLTITYTSQLCPGVHKLTMSADADSTANREYFLAWLTRRVMAQRFSEVRLRS